MLAVLTSAASHVEADHAPALAQQTVAVAAAPRDVAPHGVVGSSAAECSTPCAAPAPSCTSTLRAPRSDARTQRLAGAPLHGSEVAFPTPPPRIG